MVRRPGKVNTSTDPKVTDSKKHETLREIKVDSDTKILSHTDLSVPSRLSGVDGYTLPSPSTPPWTLKRDIHCRWKVPTDGTVPLPTMKGSGPREDRSLLPFARTLRIDPRQGRTLFILRQESSQTKETQSNRRHTKNHRRSE